MLRASTYSRPYALFAANRAAQRTVQCRPLFKWATKSKPKPSPSPEPKVLLEQDDLFHPFSSSPIPALRARANAVKSMAPCPVCLEVHGERKAVHYDCPSCGWPTHCSPEHHTEDKDHVKYCGRLREANEDEHDLRSGRYMEEYELPGEQPYEEAVSLANWDMLWYTRGFPSMDTERSRRHASKLLTYPITIGGILHQHSGFTVRNQRLTPEGARSMRALRSVLHSDAASSTMGNPKALEDTMRIFILGARAESSLPPHVWEQLTYLFPNVHCHVYFIGPQAGLPASKSAPSTPPTTEEASKEGSEDPVAPPTTSQSESPRSNTPIIFNPPTPIVRAPERRGRDDSLVYGVPAYTNARHRDLTLTTLQASYTDVHEQFGPFDPYTDVFFAFCPGFGFPSTTSPGKLQIEAPGEWGLVMPALLQTKCAIFVTGFSPRDVERDVRSLDGVEGVGGEFDWIITPGPNPFGSEKWDVADFDPRVMIRTNWGVWGIRAKRWEIRTRETEEWA